MDGLASWFSPQEFIFTHSSVLADLFYFEGGIILFYIERGNKMPPPTPPHDVAFSKNSITELML